MIRPASGSSHSHHCQLFVAHRPVLGTESPQQAEAVSPDRISSLGSGFALVVGDQRLEVPHDGIVTVGRSPDCQLILPEATVSSEHLRLRYSRSRGQLLVQDRRSTNGTLLDGKPLPKGEEEWQAVRPGQTLTVGSQCLKVEGPSGLRGWEAAGFKAALLACQGTLESSLVAALLQQAELDPQGKICFTGQDPQFRLNGRSVEAGQRPYFGDVLELQGQQVRYRPPQQQSSQAPQNLFSQGDFESSLSQLEEGRSLGFGRGSHNDLRLPPGDAQADQEQQGYFSREYGKVVLRSNRGRLPLGLERDGQAVPLEEPQVLVYGDVVRLGSQKLTYQKPLQMSTLQPRIVHQPAWLSQALHDLKEGELVRFGRDDQLGNAQKHLIFPGEDLGVSREQGAFARQGGKLKILPNLKAAPVYLQQADGSWQALEKPTPLAEGDVLRIGGQSYPVEPAVTEAHETRLHPNHLMQEYGGVLIEQHGVVSPEFRQAVQRGLDSIPQSLRDLSRPQGRKLLIAQEAGQAIPSYQGVRARGHQHTNLSGIGGVYDPNRRRFAVFEFEGVYRAGQPKQLARCQRVEAIVRHEYGHVVDDLQGHSGSSGFVQAYQEDLQGFSAKDGKRLAYFVQGTPLHPDPKLRDPDDAGRQEVFAEVFNVLLGGSGDPGRDRYLLGKFPGVRSYLEKEVLQLPPVPPAKGPLSQLADNWKRLLR